MKILITVGALLSLWSVGAFAGEWTHRAEEGEDATSIHYYFYETNGDSVQRVRWVWNGGAQSLPTVTEYLIGPEKITIRHLVGKREDIANLITGQDTELVIKNEYSITTKSSAELLLPPPPAITLSDTQRVDLGNLIDLLAIDRKPITDAPL